MLNRLKQIVHGNRNLNGNYKVKSSLTYITHMFAFFQRHDFFALCTFLQHLFSFLQMIFSFRNFNTQQNCLAKSTL